MPQNFIFPQRDRPMLMPVDRREWLPEDDLVFVVLGAVAALDLVEFRRGYRADGHGRAAFDPEMMAALLLYGYRLGERSSRVTGKRCVRDVAYRASTSPGWSNYRAGRPAESGGAARRAEPHPGPWPGTGWHHPAGLTIRRRLAGGLTACGEGLSGMNAWYAGRSLRTTQCVLPSASTDEATADQVNSCPPSTV
jgi:hypothetical protein